MINKKTALYCRLSVDDKSNGDSNSIINQKKLLQDFAVKNKLADFEFYIDDGYSGTTFNRPAFNKMLEDINDNLIDTVIVKDMSRFGRNYLQVGYYTEIFFVEKDIRFIAINDDVDSSLSVDNDFTPFRNIMNEWYARDTSRKVTAVFKAKGQTKTLTNNPPYGYKKDANGNWIIDEEAAKIVKDIFDMYVSGLGIGSIATILKKRKVFIPTYYKNNVLGIKVAQKPIPEERKCIWNTATVLDILKNKAYTGDTTNFRTYRKSFKDKKIRYTDESQQVVLKNTHEAIIDKDTFELVKSLRNSKRCERKFTYVVDNDIFQSFLICSDCEKKLYIRRHKNVNLNFYYCSTYKKYGLCSIHSIKVNYLHDLVSLNLKRLCNLDNNDNLLQILKNQKITKENNKYTSLQKLICEYENKLDKTNKIIKILYSDRANAKISIEQFNQLYNQYANDMQKYKDKISEIKKNLELRKEETDSIKKFIANLRKYKAEFENSSLSVENLYAVVDKIYIHNGIGTGKNKTVPIDIIWKYVGSIDFSNVDFDEVKN